MIDPLCHVAGNGCLSGGSPAGKMGAGPSRHPYWSGGGQLGASAAFDASAQLAAASARLSACAAHLAQLAAKAALAPMHTTYAMLSEDILRYEVPSQGADPPWPDVRL